MNNSEQIFQTGKQHILLVVDMNPIAILAYNDHPQIWVDRKKVCKRILDRHGHRFFQQDDIWFVARDIFKKFLYVLGAACNNNQT